MLLRDPLLLFSPAQPRPAHLPLVPEVWVLRWPPQVLLSRQHFIWDSQSAKLGQGHCVGLWLWWPDVTFFSSKKYLAALGLSCSMWDLIA